MTDFENNKYFCAYKQCNYWWLSHPLKNSLVNIIQFLGLKIKMFETGNQPDYLHDIRITSPLSLPHRILLCNQFC